VLRPSRLSRRDLQGAIDPASRGRQQADGKQMMQMCRYLGLQWFDADYAVESGLFEVWQRLSTGRLKIFSHCTNTLAERRLYRRDDKGRVVKEFDYAMDALRYLSNNLNVMAAEPARSASDSMPWRDRLKHLHGVSAGSAQAA
jgi:hypothetical protein